MGTPRVALVVKRTAYDHAKDLPDDPLFGLLERGDPTVANVMASHEAHWGTVAEVKQALGDCGVEVQRIRGRREEFDADAFDLIVTVGGDGTLLGASHRVGATPVLAINSAPTSSVGFFCGARKGEVHKAIKAALRGKLNCMSLTRMRVLLNGEVVDQRVLNDALFCHQSPAATSRYILEYRGVLEEQKSSGFWIGPAAGSTAAQRSAGGRVLPLTSRSLQCVVREPYTPAGEPTRLAKILVRPGKSLVVRSKSRKMRMYLDGPELSVRVDLGDVVEFNESPEPLNLLGIPARRRWAELRV
jgi:NAD+ kinase